MRKAKSHRKKTNRVLKNRWRASGNDLKGKFYGLENEFVIITGGGFLIIVLIIMMFLHN